ncbi:MAG: GIY-YIG nuclease family protein [Thermomonas sp.]
MSDEDTYPRFASQGRTFVYVLPCRDEDLLKVGFSRDPLGRFRTLHRRYFDFFDLDRGLLLEVEHLREARRIERFFIETFAADRSPAPMVIPLSAAGHTEWFRGVSVQADALARQLCAQHACVLHAPLADWIRRRFGDWSELLHDWSSRMLALIQYEHFNVHPAERQRHAERALRGVLDAYVALDLDIDALVPETVAAWYHTTGHHVS